MNRVFYALYALQQSDTGCLLIESLLFFSGLQTLHGADFNPSGESYPQEGKNFTLDKYQRATV
jgi:hypothetical protein